MDVGQLYLITKNKGEEKAVTNTTCAQTRPCVGFRRREQVRRSGLGTDRRVAGIEGSRDAGDMGDAAGRGGRERGAENVGASAAQSPSLCPKVGRGGAARASSPDP